MRRLLAITNPAAGGADDETRHRVLAVLREHADVAEAPVKDPGELPGVLADHLGRDPVVLGGDGTLHCLVAALALRGELRTRTVGLIPLGTGNDMARALDIPLDPEEAARVVVRGTPRWLDHLRDPSGDIVINAFHLGVGVEAARTARPLKPVLRRFAYAAGSLIAGARTKGRRLKVVVDGEIVADGERRVLMVGAGNGTSIGGGTPMTPDALPDDGLADVIVSFATRPTQRLMYGVLLRAGRHPRHDQVVTTRGSHIRISGEAVPLNADGELIGPITDRTWRVEPRSWRIIVP
jgi:diacylglycerol kinase family enzyme